MEDLTIDLPTDLDSCHSLIRELLETLRQQGLLIGNMQHQLERLLRQRYGRSSEKIDPDQLLLFAADILAEANATPAIESQPAAADDALPCPATAAKPKPKRKGHGRKPLPAHLERRPVVHDVPPDQLTCPDCGGRRQAFGEEVREQLDFVPASLVVIQHIRPQYACKACQANVVIADRLPEPIEKGLPGPGLLAQVIVSKYADHLPLYRQERTLARQGVAISRQTMCGWMATCAALLKPIYDAMVKEVLKSKAVQTDDTPVDVLDPGREGTRTGRIWIAIGDRGHRYSVYDFTPNRSGDGPARFFKDYQGYLQADAYGGYDALFKGGKIIEVGCWAHARRKFYEAKTTDPQRAHMALAYIRRLDAVESDATAAKLDDAARHALRQERSVPILGELFAWLEGVRAQVLPKSPMGEAIGYALNHKAALLRYTEQGFLEIDNNASERGEKTIAIGRKNWLFFGSEGGGATAAILFSLTESCKGLGVEPWAYLRDVLDRVSTHPASRIDELLPDRWETIRRRREAATLARPVEGTADPPEPGAEPEGERPEIRDRP
jgi:transposase